MNRNKLITLLISNLSNVVVHKILERAIDKPEISSFYNKEVKNSFEIAKKYREKINPSDKILPTRDIDEVREKIIKRVNAELNLRISRGYMNIDVSLVEKYVEETLKELKVI
jgi:hypothetical protein